MRKRVASATIIFGEAFLKTVQKTVGGCAQHTSSATDTSGNTRGHLGSAQKVRRKCDRSCCRSVDTLCLFGMSDSLRFKRAVVFVNIVQKVKKEAGPPFGWELAMAGRSGSFLFFTDVHRFFQATDNSTGNHIACVSNLYKTKQNIC